MKHIKQNDITGKVTINNDKEVSMLNDMDKAPTTIKKIVPGPRIDETSIMH